MQLMILINDFASVDLSVTNSCHEFSVRPLKALHHVLLLLKLFNFLSVLLLFLYFFSELFVELFLLLAKFIGTLKADLIWLLPNMTQVSIVHVHF